MCLDLIYIMISLIIMCHDSMVLTLGIGVKLVGTNICPLTNDYKVIVVHHIVLM